MLAGTRPTRGDQRESATSASLRDEVLDGLRHSPRTLPPKLFYDARGAALFDAITRLDEYYLTRTELAILRRHAAPIAASIGAGSVLLEYGSGEAEKVRIILDRMRGDAAPAAYVPIDVSGAQLERVAEELRERYPEIPIIPIAADYTSLDGLPLPPDLRAARRVAFFPGSTIGNLHPEEARHFLERMAADCGSEGAIILGVDLRKDPAILHAAYNDSEGLTAEFNLNILVRLNRELGATFDPESFRHYAFYNPVAGRIEMHLVSLRRQLVSVAGECISFERGETIWTESSYKYTLPGLAALASEAGLIVDERWTDPDELFVVVRLVAGQARG
ncbi:MAG TPA: L-histidine N(alpha)-methyltransferase [Gemmatimonadaceae bacterium]|jgi:dimethylhistidine N-methyltransferase|nr:L-histidine N(alpha)-methyltransferase [Gemmatimonadaceae bacterium]